MSKGVKWDISIHEGSDASNDLKQGALKFAVLNLRWYKCPKV
jgi:hypothetical protein